MDPTHRGPQGRDGRDSGALARTVQLVANEYLLTVNPVDGSEIEMCPPADLPASPERHTPDARAALDRAAAPSPPVGPAADIIEGLPLLERQDERERLVRLLARGRSVRLVGRPGSGRTALLNAVAEDCAGIAPDGVIRLSGHRRTPTDLLHELFAAVFHAPRQRLGRDELLAMVSEIGAVVVLDDIAFGGEALEELLRLTPECAFLISVRPDLATVSEASGLTEVVLTGLSREACQQVLEHAVRRPLSPAEQEWAADLWAESEGLPLRFLQAGAVLRQRDALRSAALSSTAGSADAVPLTDSDESGPPLTALDIAASLSHLAREALRYGLALEGELPHPSHLPALVDDSQADAALAELAAAGLATPTGQCYRLSGDIAEQLWAADFTDSTADADRVLRAAQHYAWWAGHPSVTPERVATETGAVLAAIQGAKSGGNPSSAALLAHTAAPVFATALRWSAWEQALRGGQEAARLGGEVAEEAYFHHELGVLALCLGNVQRARTELEASIGLRGALADKRGAVAGRRALALVEDRSSLAAGPAALAAPHAGTGAPSVLPADVSTPSATTAPTPTLDATRPFAGQPGVAATSRAGATDGEGRYDAAPQTASSRRKLVAVGAGVLGAVALGAAITVGATSVDDEPEGGPGPVASTTEEQGDTFPVEEPDTDSTSRPNRPEPSEPATSGSPSESPSPSETTSPSESPTEDPTTPTEDPTTPSEDPTTPSEDPTTPTEDPTTPTEEPTPTDEPSDPDPTEEPSESSSTAEPTPSSTDSSPRSPAPSGPTEQPPAGGDGGLTIE